MKLLAILACTAFLTNAIEYTKKNKFVNCGETYFQQSTYSDPKERLTVVRSFNLGKGNYSNNEECIVEFVTKTNEPVVVNLIFSIFDLQNSTDCMSDYICMSGTLLCGNNAGNKWYTVRVPENSSFTLRFKSDSDVTSAGFEVAVWTTDDEEGNVAGYADKCKIVN